MAHKQKVPSRGTAGDLLLMLAMRGLEQGGRPTCLRYIGGGVLDAPDGVYGNAQGGVKTPPYEVTETSNKR